MIDANSKNKTADRSPISYSSIAAVLAALGVGLGAFGAHALEETLLSRGTLDTWKTAQFYHLAHAIALFFLARGGAIPRWPARLLVAGILLFSGSLYLLALTGWSWLGPVTPFGGLSFIAAWILLALRRPIPQPTDPR